MRVKARILCFTSSLLHPKFAWSLVKAPTPPVVSPLVSPEVVGLETSSIVLSTPSTVTVTLRSVLEIVVMASVVVISRGWAVCVVVVVLVAASLLAIITLVDWRRGKVDGREVAVLGQRICCCYLRLIELCILRLEGRRWGVHLRPIWHYNPL